MSNIAGIDPLRLCTPEFFRSDGDPYSFIVETWITRHVQEMCKRNLTRDFHVGLCIETLLRITGSQAYELDIIESLRQNRMLVQVALYASCVSMRDRVMTVIKKIYRAGNGFQLGLELRNAFLALKRLFVNAMDREKGYYRVAPQSSRVSFHSELEFHRAACEYISSVMSLSAARRVDDGEIWTIYKTLIY